MSDKDNYFYDELTRLNNELANIQRELFKKNAELEALNEQKNRFIGMAAHDLRNPLGVIFGSSQCMMESMNLNEEQMEFAAMINDSSKFMLELVNDILDISKIESGKVELKISGQDLNEIIKDSVKVNKIMAARKNIELNFENSSRQIPVNIDIHKIRQVLDNLISNAIKFSFPGSAVEVAAGLKDGAALVCVKDSGQGIAEDELHKLFQPFSRTSTQSTAGEMNTGLGLAICKKIIESHGGKIWAESAVKKGTSFYFTLPPAD